MLAGIWGVALGPVYALELLQEQMRQYNGRPPREPRRRLRKLLGRLLGLTGRGLVRLGDRLNGRLSETLSRQGCG
jgi:hypothetical protein